MMMPPSRINLAAEYADDDISAMLDDTNIDNGYNELFDDINPNGDEQLFDDELLHQAINGGRADSTHINNNSLQQIQEEEVLFDDEEHKKIVDCIAAADDDDAEEKSISCAAAAAKSKSFDDDDFKKMVGCIAALENSNDSFDYDPTTAIAINNDVRQVSDYQNEEQLTSIVETTTTNTNTAYKTPEDYPPPAAPHHNQSQQQPSLRQWIQVQSKKSNNNDEYIKSALLIAQILIDHIIDNDKKAPGEENEYYIPLDSLRSNNVMFNLQGFSDPDQGIIRVMNSSSPVGSGDYGNVSDVGNVQSRLFAVGLILYELFSTEELLIDQGIPSFVNAPTSSFAQGIDLNDDTSSGHEDKGNQNRPQKRSLRHTSSSSSTTAGDMISTRITDLEGRAPRSVCTLVKNLLDCSKGDFCGSDTYSSFADLRQDLKLMVEDPTCYLNDIQVSKSLPTLEICDKLYGREVEETKLDGFYQQYISEKTSRGVTISGGAGAGKSRLALHALKLTSESNGLFSAAKFEQNQLNSKPLQAVGELFNALCDVFVEGVTPNDLLLVEYELQASLGNQAGLLMGVVPNLMKLMPSYRIGFEAPSNCMNAAASIGYLFGELLRVITSHSKRPISLFLDDIQFADNESLLLIGQLLFIAKSITPSVFFLFCHRDDEASLSPPFGLWLNHTVTTFSLKSIELGDMSVDSVNSLVSETLHLSPRITRPLSAVLHHKSRGNPLFLTQLLGSLQGQGYIYFDLGQCKWSWDMDKIVEEPVASSVVVLLMKEMKRLPPNLQLGLGVASCLGSFIQKDVLDILSKDLNVDLIDILNQVSKKGFMDNLDNGATFRFAHDKIQEAAYELQSNEHRRKDHLKYGLILCSHTLDDSTESSELFFTSIAQINRGDPELVKDQYQRGDIADLNLKAGRLAIAQSGHNTAYTLFEFGIKFLGESKWKRHYELTCDLFDSMAETACVLNKASAVEYHVNELVDNAKSFDDSLHCLYIAAKSYINSNELQKAVTAMFKILSMLGEATPRATGDKALMTDIDAMNQVLQDRDDSSILNLRENKEKKLVTLHRLYTELALVIQFTEPQFTDHVSCRLIDITMAKGLTQTSPLSFVYFGTTLASMGKVEEGCRLGRLALKLVEKNASSSKYKPLVIASVYYSTLWYVEPFQAVAEEHQLGYRVGKQLGDFTQSLHNSFLSVKTSHLAGQNVSVTQSYIKDEYRKLCQDNNEQNFLPDSVLLHYHAIALREGLHVLNAGRVDDIPTESEIQTPNLHSIFSSKLCKLERSFLFRQLNSNILDEMKIYESIVSTKMALRSSLCVGIFYEGLSCYLVSRLSATIDPIEKMKLIERGRSTLAKVRSLAEHSSWNWENKVLLLEAMEMHTLGNLDAAEPLYTSSVRSAQEHKFIHEEAIASELAGEYLYEQGKHSDAYALFMHSVKCFEEWGADAVAKRVETSVQSKFGANVSHLQATNIVDTMKRILSLDQQQQHNQKRELS